MITAEIEPASTHAMGGNPRAMGVDAHVGRNGYARAICRVSDMSSDGARLETYSRLTRGSRIWLTLPMIGAQAAVVTWSDDFAAGCAFEKAIPEAMLDCLTEMAGPVRRFS